MFRDSEMKHLPALVLQDDEHKQHSKSDGRDGEEIRRHDLSHMVVQKGLPRLRRGPFHGLQDTGNGPFRNVDSELEELTVNARRTPQGIRADYGLNELANRLANRRSAYISARSARPSRPIPTKMLPLPTHDSVRMDHDQGSSPALPHPRHDHPEHSVGAI
jgi:hypothetical protein